MSDEVVGTKITYSIDINQAKAALKELAAGTTEASRALVDSLGSAVENTSRRMKKLADDVSGNGATRKLEELARVVEGLGGVSSLTAPAVDNLSRRIQALVSAGGSAPASIAGLTRSVSGLDTALKGAGIQQAQSLSSNLGPLGGVLSAIGPAGLAAAAGLGAVTVAGGAVISTVGAIIQKTVETGDKFDDLSAKSRISVTELQNYARAGSTAGVDVETFVKGVQSLSVEIIKANPALKAMGLDAAKLRQMLPEDAFRVFAQRIAELKNPMEQQAALQAVLHKSGKELAGALENLAAAAEKGKTLNLSPEQVKAAADMADAQVRVSAAAAAVGLQFGSAALQGGGLTKTVDIVTAELEHLANWVSQHKGDIGAFFEAGAKWAQSLVVGAEAAIDKLSKLAPLLPHSAAAGAAAGAIAGPAGSLVGAAVGGAVGLYDAARAKDYLSQKDRHNQAGAPVDLMGVKNAPGAGALWGPKQLYAQDAAGPGYEDPAAAAEKQRIANAVKAESIKLEEEYKKAIASSAEGLDAQILAIQANATAERERINAQQEWSAAQKAGLQVELAKAEAAQIAAARMAAARKSAAEATQHFANAERIASAAVEAGLSPLEVQVRQIEASRAAKQEQLGLDLQRAFQEGRYTQELRKSIDAEMDANDAAAKGATERATAIAARELEANSIASVNKAEQAYAAAIERANPSLEHQIAQIYKKRDADIAQSLAAFKAGNITAEALRRDIILYGAAADAAAAYAKKTQTSRTLNDVAQTGGQVLDSLEQVGIKGDSKYMRAARGEMQAVEGAGQFAHGYATGNVAEAIQGGVKALAGQYILVKSLLGGKSGTDRALETLTRDFGKAGAAAGGKWSEELAKKIEVDLKRVGDRAATLLHLTDIINEAGGIKEFGADKAASALQDLFTQVESGKVTIAEAGHVFDENFGAIAAESVSKTTGMASAQLLMLIDISKRMGVESPGVKEFMKSQSEGLLGNLSGIVGGMKASRDTLGGNAGRDAERATRNQLKDSGLSDEEIEARVKRAGDAAAGAAAAGVGIVSQKAASALGSTVAATFQQMIDSGLSRGEAFEKIGPLVATMREELTAAGYEGGAAFGQLEQTIGIVTGELSGPLVSGISSSAGAMVNLYNMGLLNKDTFEGLTEQVGANIKALSEQGIEGPAAMQALQPDLQKIWELQQKTHFEVDGTTQSMIDSGVASGALGEEHRSTADKMLAATDRMAGALEFIAGKYGYVASEADKAMKDRNATNTVTTNFNSNGSPPPPPPGGPSWHSEPNDQGEYYYARGSGGLVNFGPEARATLHRKEAVVTEAQFNAPRVGINFSEVGLRSMLGSASPASATRIPSAQGGGGGVSVGDISVTVHVSDSGDPDRTARAVVTAIRNGAAGELVTAIREAGAGA